MIGERWPREAYEVHAVSLAKKLLGSYLVHVTAGTTYAGRIVETEAYGGTYRRQPDDGAHSFHGCTKRTEPMFRAGGCSYVYLIYGMYYCVNVVAGPAGSGEAVLIRAVEPVLGVRAMLANRKAAKASVNLTNGPGKLCQAMAITKEQNMLDLCGAELYIAAPARKKRLTVLRSPRIYIDYAEKGKCFFWRFYIKDNPYVSRR